MLYISSAVVLSESYVSLENPTFLWRNLVTVSGITADHAAASYPATNLANPQTSSLWKSGSISDQNIVFDVTPDQPVDAFAIARHNFGSGAVGLKVYGITAEPGATFELLADLSPGDDSPIFGIVNGGYYDQIKFSLEPGSVAPQAAVVYIGSALIMPRSTPAGFVPLKDGVVRDELTGFAENGDFLGDIIVSEKLSTSVTFRLLDGAWYRENMRPFVQSGAPFFYCWSPALAPGESGFAKFDTAPQGQVTQFGGEMDVSLSITGLAL